ncbi:molybdate ABC transporter substrate-binding protein [Enterocloster citroniae]|uniref:molybdate ABC transporter substrate-binding protein n=1 Tax=Enterocloster citroniae TaxID=358743 RepID=UPI00349E8782
MKKKTLAVLLAAALGASMLWGCGKGNDAGASATPASTTAESTDSSTASGTESGIQLPDLTGHTLMIYCGAGMTKPFQEIADAFKSHTGCEMNVTYANAGQIQSQITTSEEGDLFIAGSGDELKPVESYVEGKKELVKHIPVLAVQSGNPKNITGLADLTGDGVTLIMGDVDSTPIGKIAKKAMTDAGIFDQVQIEATTATAPQMSTALAAKEADAAIVWKENCDAQDVEIVNTTDLDPYIKTIPAASLSCAADKDALEAFNQYLDMDTAKEIWVKYGYEIVE